MELVQHLMKQLGVNEQQAQGGIGLLMNAAREKLPQADFQKVQALLPGLDDLLKGANSPPPAGVEPAAGSGGLLGSLGGLAKQVGLPDLGGLAGLAGGFQKLGLDVGSIGKFVTSVLQFIETKGGGAVKDLLSKVLKP
jgi:hypothetical protein